MYAYMHVCMRDVCIHARARTHTILGSYMTNRMQLYSRARMLCVFSTRNRAPPQFSFHLSQKKRKKDSSACVYAGKNT